MRVNQADCFDKLTAVFESKEWVAGGQGLRDGDV